MPAITFSATPIDYHTLTIYLSEMAGNAKFYQHRNAVIERVHKIWPTLATGITPQDPEWVEKRDMPIEPKEQTAIAEGLLSLFKDARTYQHQRIQIEKMCKLLRFETWLKKNTSGDDVADFTETDEDVTGHLDP